MEVAAEAEFQYGGYPLPLPADFLDADVPLSSIHNLLDSSQLDFDSFDLSIFESRDLSSKWQMDTSSSTDNLSDDCPPSLIMEDNNSISSTIPEAYCPQEDRRCRNPQGNCTSLATGVLRSMHAGSSSCILSMRSQDGNRDPQLSRAADAILSMNQFALRAVRSILSCPCNGSPQVLLVVTAICSEITAWYWHIVDIYYGHCRNSTAASGAILPASMGKVEIRRRDFFIGSHRLSKDVETALIRQVLSGMLQELHVVIGDIACHNTGQSPAANDPRSDDPILSGVRSRMVAFLHSQLRALTSALNHSDSDFGTLIPPISHY